MKFRRAILVVAVAGGALSLTSCTSSSSVPPEEVCAIPLQMLADEPNIDAIHMKVDNVTNDIIGDEWWKMGCKYSIDPEFGYLTTAGPFQGSFYVSKDRSSRKYPRKISNSKSRDSETITVDGEIVEVNNRAARAGYISANVDGWSGTLRFGSTDPNTTHDDELTDEQIRTRAEVLVSMLRFIGQ